MQFLYISDIELVPAEQWTRRLAEQMNKEFVTADAETRVSWTDATVLADYTESHAIDMIIWSVADNRKAVQRVLNLCRELRIPYIIFTPRCFPTEAPHTTPRPIERQGVGLLLAPVTMLEEEVYKAEIIAHLMRFTGCHTTLLQAKDYGSRAATNCQRIRTALSRFDLSADMRIGTKDSMHLYRTLHYEQADLFVLTASREYGLDDILFGPAERYVILHASAPVLLINPRGDLFSLCD